jgi:hypothetical protein
VLGVGVDPSRALVISQVVLSFGIPFALVPLVLLTRRATSWARWSTAAHDGVASVVAALIIGLNVVPARADVQPASSVRADGPRRHVPADRRLAARRLDRPAARRAHLRRDQLHGRGGRSWSRATRQPYSKYDWHWRVLVAHRFGHAAAPSAVHTALKLLDEAGIDGEIALREMRTGRARSSDVGSARVGAPGVPAHPGAVGRSVMARVALRIPDLMLHSRVLESRAPAGTRS